MSLLSFIKLLSNYTDFEEMGFLVGDTGRETLEKKNRHQNPRRNALLKRGSQIKHTLGVDTGWHLKKF